MINLPIDQTVWHQLDPLEQVDVVCDAFESDCKKGLPCDLTDYVKLVSPKLAPFVMRELALLEVECRALAMSKSICEGGQNPEVDAAADTNGDLNRGELHSLPGGELRLPLNIGRFVLLQRIGRGSCGDVYRAEDKISGLPVAVKIPHRHLLADPDDERRFVREARNAARLSHPGIVTVHDVGQSEFGPFLVSEFVHGENLKNVLREGGRLPFEIAANLVADVADALSHVHLNGVIHRDLKPSNIIVDEQGGGPAGRGALPHLRPRLLDFGVARLLGSNTLATRQGDLVGTPAYMSPEQARGEAHLADARSDIYSLGVILYELLSGATPFSGDTHGVINQIRSHEVPQIKQRNPLIPTDLANVCHQCLAHDPKRRYQSAADLAFDLRSWLDGKPVSARPPSVSELAWRRLAAYWRHAATGVTITTVVLSAAVFVQSHHSKLGEVQHSVATQLIERLTVAPSGEITGIIDRLRILPESEQSLAAFRSNAELSPRARLRLWLVGLPDSLNQATPLLPGISDAGPEELIAVGASLASHAEVAIPVLRSLVVSASTVAQREEQFRLACLLGTLDSSEFVKLDIGPDFVNWLMAVAHEHNSVWWAKLVAPFAKSLISPLSQAYAAESNVARRTAACTILATLLEDQPNELARSVCVALPNELPVWIETLARNRDAALAAISIAVESCPAPLGEDVVSEKAARQQANLLLAQLALGDTDKVFPALRASPDPRICTYMIHALSATRIPPDTLLEKLSQESDASVQYSLIIALGLYAPEQFSEQSRRSVKEWVVQAYATHPDSGVHSACRWMLERFGETELVAAIDERLMGEGIVEGRSWYVNSLGLHMVLIAAPVKFWMGAAENDVTAEQHERGHWHRIDRPFAISATEVTFAQYQQFDRAKVRDSARTTGPNAPSTHVSWSDCHRFCQWLSEREGMTAEQARTLTELPDNEVQVNYQKVGYRLPSSAEWELACRAGTTTARFHGGQLTPYFEMYAWQSGRQALLQQVGAVIPNRLGLFDTLGNAEEWVSTRLDGGIPLFPDEQSLSSFRVNMACLIRGGACDRQSDLINAWCAGVWVLKDPSTVIGFRIARTIDFVSSTTQFPKNVPLTHGLTRRDSP